MVWTNNGKNSTSVLLATAVLQWLDMPTTQTTEMTHSSAKKVCCITEYSIPSDHLVVCVSSLMIQEIKRIIKDSEVMK